MIINAFVAPGSHLSVGQHIQQAWCLWAGTMGVV